MKQIEFVRNRKMEDYVLYSQAFFVILGGLLFARAWNSVMVATFSLYRNLLLLALPLLVFIVVKHIEKRRFRYSRNLEILFNSFYLVITSFLLIFEKESFFKFLLLMPVVVNSLQYGTKKGYIWAFLASGCIVFINMFNSSSRFDVDILVIGLIWLFAWLLGQMSKTERDIREDLQRLAAIDGLTGAYNHRSFYYFLDEFYTQVKIDNKSLALIMIDVDFFKYYNDAYGHQRGDMILNKLAQMIDEEIVEVGICARYGGDEFAVLLPGFNSEVAVQVAEKIRKKVEEYEFDGASILPSGHLTISVGVSSYPEHADCKEHLLQRGDEALYRAKSINSNKVEVYYSVFDEMSHVLQDKDKDLLNSLKTLLMVVNAKDRYTYGHSERVMHYAMHIGKRLALWEWELQELAIGALLHDIGKIEIQRDILNKPDKLTFDEWECICQHPIWGADMIRPISTIKGAMDIILYHHENYDGSGYPFALKGEEIPLGARILRVADSFDAMTSNRPYKQTMSIVEAIEDLEHYREDYYDPNVLDAFLEYIRETGILADRAIV